MSETPISMTHNPYLIHPAAIVGKRQEFTDIVTFRLKLTGPAHQKAFKFKTGQFNRLYVFIMSDPDEPGFLDHTTERNLSQLWNVGGKVG